MWDYCVCKRARRPSYFVNGTQFRTVVNGLWFQRSVRAGGVWITTGDEAFKLRAKENAKKNVKNFPWCPFFIPPSLRLSPSVLLLLWPIATFPPKCSSRHKYATIDMDSLFWCRANHLSPFRSLTFTPSIYYVFLCVCVCVCVCVGEGVKRD